ncbi:queD [Lepeophtheirus salmonis]|uniref:6-pyruvoyltetrahydropterin synthase n=1 Tax=Lepeophtheirus salmonis TaxID=72036 RepID=A0A7R8H589_LEPSM|nr:queD [Lepeophtheirus salmonis]CAF2876748.1 queD [Lepeophtheirus salmonis]
MVIGWMELHRGEYPDFDLASIQSRYYCSGKSRDPPKGKKEKAIQEEIEDAEIQKKIQDATLITIFPNHSKSSIFSYIPNSSRIHLLNIVVLGTPRQNNALSPHQNLQIFGKCNNPNGHGHNYVMEVTVSGPPDPITGMTMNLSDLKDLISHHVLEVLDHKNIDKDVPYFSLTNKTSTSENMAIFIWESLFPHLNEGFARLYEVKLWETEKNIVVYRG